MVKIPNKSYRMTIKYFILFFTILFCASFYVLSYMEEQSTSIQKKELASLEEIVLNSENIVFNNVFYAIFTDLTMLHDQFHLVYDVDNKVEPIVEIWKVFSQEKAIYDQIRFIDKNGNEKIRINYSGERAYVVNGAGLQNKKDEYYFIETAALNEGQVYISKMDLNLVNDEIQLPIKPMIRFSTPIFDKDNQFVGIIVINYNVENLIEEFGYIAESANGDTYLLNSDGYVISGPNPEEEWAFMFDEKLDISFGKKYPEEWEIIKNQKNGTMITKNGFFVFNDYQYENITTNQKIDSKTKGLIIGNENLMMVSHISNQSLNGYIFESSELEKTKRVFYKYIPLYILIALVSLFVAPILTARKKSMAIMKLYSDYDGMTKILNRRAGLALLQKEITRDNRKNGRLSLCFMDVNGLKEVNDTLGHEVGDELLMTVVDVIRKTIGRSDYMIRFGGDEFAIVFTNSNYEQAEMVWSRILDEFDYINTNGNLSYLISVSHGITDYDELKGINLDDFIKIADERMYQEKREIKKNFFAIRNPKQA